jgi:hypothetical protein
MQRASRCLKISFHAYLLQAALTVLLLLLMSLLPFAAQSETLAPPALHYQTSDSFWR